MQVRPPLPASVLVRKCAAERLGASRIRKESSRTGAITGVCGTWVNFLRGEGTTARTSDKGDDGSGPPSYGGREAGLQRDDGHSLSTHFVGVVLVVLPGSGVGLGVT